MKQVEVSHSLLHSPTAIQALSTAFFVLALVVAPLSLPPEILGSVELNSENFTQFRALVLAATVSVGLVVLLLTSSARLETIARWRPHHWQLGLLGLIVWLLISTGSTGTSPWAPGLGSPDRMDGTLIQAGWLSLALIGYGIARVSKLTGKRLLSYLLITALVTSIWSFLQGVDLDPLTLLTGHYLDIPAGAFGHGALASCFIVVAILVAAATWSNAARPQWVLRSAAFLCLGLGLASTAGRAAIVALILGAVVSLLTLRLKRRSTARLLIYFSAVVAGMLVPIVVVPRAQAQLTNTISAFEGNDLSLNARFASWRGGLRLLAANPLFGVGPGGFGYSVWPYLSETEAATMIRDPLGSRLDGVDLSRDNYVITSDVIAIVDQEGQLLVTNLGWDKAHNYVLDLGLMSGVPAAILFLYFVGSAGITLWRGRSVTAKGFSIGLLAYLVFGLAWFPMLGLEPVMWVGIGAALGISELSANTNGSSIRASGNYDRSQGTAEYHKI